MDTVNAARVIAGGGTAECEWRQWLLSSDIPRRAFTDLVSPCTRLVVVAPHPDDELLACGGLLAKQLAGAGRALVIGVTDGEASHAGAADWDATQLARSRGVERVQGLRHLAGRQVDIIRLRLPDGQVIQHADKLYRTLMCLLQPSDVVVSTWRLDGHPDHEITGWSAARACLLVGCQLLEAPVWMWHWASPEDVRVPWHRLVAMPLSSWAMNRKQHAVTAHTTQLQDRGAGLGAVLGPAIVERAARDTEYFFV
jgi:LmbE family N-acetylglucosaminyl deacetylase